MNLVERAVSPTPTFFQKLLDKRAQEPSAVEAFFSTHPTDQSRVAGTRKQISALGLAASQDLMRDSPEVHIIQARVKAMPPPPKAPPKPQLR